MTQLLNAYKCRIVKLIINNYNNSLSKSVWTASSITSACPEVNSVQPLIFKPMSNVLGLHIELFHYHFRPTAGTSCVGICILANVLEFLLPLLDRTWQISVKNGALSSTLSSHR